MMRRILLVTAFFVGLLDSNATAQTLDQYGGYANLPVPGGGNGTFRVAKLGDRWVWVTPVGNAFWLRGVYGMDRGGSYETAVIAKYGDADLTWAPQQNRRLQSWGFNALAEYANGYATPWATISDPRWPTGTQPVKMPAVFFPLQAASYSKRNLFGFASQPVKDLYAGLDSHFTGYRGQFPDVFDPNFAQWIAGRLASKEYATAAASPYLLGLSSDDTDYLTGFGPGPDFPTQPVGKVHPHLGFVALIGPPTQTSNPFSGGTTYTDTKVYTKTALMSFLLAKYGTVGALNTAWGSTYTVFGSDGGWPTGQGLLDENGKGAWVGAVSDEPTGSNATLRADLDAFLYEIAKQYFSTYRAAITAKYPKTLFLGSTTIGGWGAPPRRQILKAAGENVDVVRMAFGGGQAALDFIAQHAGDKPLVTWLGAVANPDSDLSQFPNGDQSDKFATQAERGQFYAAKVTSLLSAVATPTGSKPFIGLQWWAWLSSGAEQASWGLVTFKDNAYDGREATVASGTDAWGFGTGGEERNYGNFLGTVASANANVESVIRGSNPTGGGGGTTTLSVAMTAPSSGTSVSGTTTVSASATSNASRIDLLLDGQVAAIIGGLTSVRYTWDTRTAANTWHRWQAKAYDSTGGTALSSPVDVQVANIAPPTSTPLTVKLDTPLNNQAVTQKSRVVLSATATGGTIAVVNFYVNGSLMCSDTLSPYACPWQVPAAAGKSYQLQVTALDTGGRTATSPITTVRTTDPVRRSAGSREPTSGW